MIIILNFILFNNQSLKVNIMNKNFYLTMNDNDLKNLIILISKILRFFRKKNYFNFVNVAFCSENEIIKFNS